MRLLPSLVGAALVVLVAAIARELGGGRKAQLLAAIGAATNWYLLGSNWLFQTVVFDELWWLATIYVFVRLLREGDLRWWLAIGALLGLGLETKETIVGPGIGIAVALLVTPLRSQLCTRWPWCGFLLALDLYAPAFGLPSVISPSLTYWYWKPAHLDAETVIAVGASETGMRRLYRQVQVVDRIRSVAGVRNEEVGRLILVCRDPITSLDEAWPRLRSLN